MGTFVSDVWAAPNVSDRNTLVKKVVRIYGLEGNDEAKSIALDNLDDEIKEINKELWEFNIVSTSAIPVVEKDEDYTLPTLFYREKLAYFEETSTGNRGEPMVYMDWVSFRRLYGSYDKSFTDRPRAYSVKNSQREGLVYLGQRPDADTQDNFTLYMDYYRRIPLLSTTAQLEIPQEVENMLLYGAQMRFARDIVGVSHPDVNTYKALHDDAKTQLAEIDRRHPDEVTRFRMNDRFSGQGRYRRNQVYVRIG